VPRRAVMPGRLRRRLTVAFVVVAGVAAAVLAVGSYLLVGQARFADSVRRAAADARFDLRLAAQAQPLDDARLAALRDSFRGAGREVLLVGAADADVPPVLRAATRSAVAAGQLAYQRSTDPAGRHVLVVGGRVPSSTVELYVVQSEDGIYADLSLLRNALLAGWVAVVVLAALVGRVLARRTLEPVGRASDAARAVAEGLLDTRLPAEGRDEFGAWAASFNRMAEALAARQERERRFTADVAHELRTPVTALVAEASLLREHLDGLPAPARRPAELLVADVVRLRRLVEDLMEISRLDAGQEVVVSQPVEVVGLVKSIVDVRGWADRVRVDGPAVTVASDPRRLERVLANLVANAVEHGGPAVHVTVACDGGTAEVRVADDGPGIPADQLPRLFDRFTKVDPARTGAGSGLGLAIARENARLLGADLTVSSEPGAGTVFRLAMAVTQRLPDSEGTAVRDGDGGTP
jgi:signal transduction histidine kinase